MGFYREQVFPRMVDRMLDNSGIEYWRLRAIEGLHGVVVEPGFGSGLNVPFYPPEVRRVYAVDPAELGQKLAAERLAATTVEVEFVGIDGEQLPLEDDSCDSALMTFTLCSIPDAATALLELARVLKPGGGLHFVEHGHSPDANIATWQRRIEPIQQRVGDGCHLTRDTAELIESAGFTLDWSDQRYAKGPKPWSWFTVGRALNTA